MERKSNTEFTWLPFCFMFYKTRFNQGALLTCTWKVPGSYLIWHTDYPCCLISVSREDFLDVFDSYADLSSGIWGSINFDTSFSICLVGFLGHAEGRTVQWLHCSPGASRRAERRRSFANKPVDKICLKRKGISNTSQYNNSYEEQKLFLSSETFFCESRGIPSD